MAQIFRSLHEKAQGDLAKAQQRIFVKYAAAAPPPVDYAAEAKTLNDYLGQPPPEQPPVTPPAPVTPVDTNVRDYQAQQAFSASEQYGAPAPVPKPFLESAARSVKRFVVQPAVEAAQGAFTRFTQDKPQPTETGVLPAIRHVASNVAGDVLAALNVPTSALQKPLEAATGFLTGPGGGYTPEGAPRPKLVINPGDDVETAIAKAIKWQRENLSPAQQFVAQNIAFFGVDALARKGIQVTPELVRMAKEAAGPAASATRRTLGEVAANEELAKLNEAIAAKAASPFGPRPAVQTSMGVGEKPPQGQLMPELRPQDAQVGKPSAPVAAKMTAAQERAAQVATGQTAMPAQPTTPAAPPAAAAERVVTPPAAPAATPLEAVPKPRFGAEGADQMGRWWSSSPKLASGFAERSKNGVLSYVDVPNDIAQKAALEANTHRIRTGIGGLDTSLLPPEYGRQAKSFWAGGSPVEDAIATLPPVKQGETRLFRGMAGGEQTIPVASATRPAVPPSVPAAPREAVPPVQTPPVAAQAPPAGGQPPVRGAGPTPPSGAVPPTPPSDPVKKLTDLITSAKPVRAETELLKTQALGQKAAIGQRARESGGGAAAFHGAKRSLGGELPRAQWTPPGDSLTQPEQTQLFDAIRTNNKLPFFDYVNTSGALEKVLAGVTPTNGEIKLLEKQFGPEMAKALLGQRPVWQKLLADANNAWNLPRGIKASMDFSFHMLQGGMMAFADTPTWVRTWKPALRAMWSEKNYKVLEGEITATPMFARLKARGMEWVDPLSVMGQHAEGFSAATPGLIGPAIGKAAKAVIPAPILTGLKAVTYPFRASEREFSMAGNFMRYQHLTKRFAELDAIGAPSYSYDAAVKLANMMTGRGPLNKQANAVVNFASKVFWAPRLGVSVVQTATAPIWLRGARMEATGNLAKFFGYTAGTVLAGKAVGLWDTETDPRSTNFMRVKIGATWYNPLGKYQQDVRLMGQFVTGQRKALQSGNIVEAKRLEGLARAAWSQLHPAASGLVNLEQKQNVIGEPRSLQSFDDAMVMVRDIFAPLSPDQMMRAYQEGGPVAALKQLPNVVGLNANDIPPTALDKAARSLGKDRFNQLSLEQKAQIRVDPKIRDAAKVAAGTDPLALTAWQAQEDQIARDGFMAKGANSIGEPFTHKMWLDSLNTAQDKATARRDIRELMRPIVERGANDATIQAANDYYALMKTFALPGGLFDMQGWQNAKEDYLLQLDKPLRADLMDAVGASTTPAVVAYYRLLDKARAYYDVERNVIGPDPETLHLWNKYKSQNSTEQSAMRKANPALARAVKQIDAEKEKIRKTDADVDLYLHLFKNGTLTVPANIRLAVQGKLTFAGVPVPYTPRAGASGELRPLGTGAPSTGAVPATPRAFTTPTPKQETQRVFTR